MRAFRADAAALGNNATVVLIGIPPPGGWLAQFYPDDVAFTQIEGSFPLTPLYDQKIIEMICTRGGLAYAVFEAKFNWRDENIARIDKLFQNTGLASHAKGCHLTERVITSLQLHARLEWHAPATLGPFCKLSLRNDDVRDIAAENAHLANQAQVLAQRRKLDIVLTSCSPYRAYIGPGLFHTSCAA